MRLIPRFINERMGDLVCRTSAKLAQDPFVDLVVKDIGDFYIFWPISKRSKETVPEVLKDFPKKRGGYRVPKEKFDFIYGSLRDDWGMFMAWLPMMSLSEFLARLKSATESQ